MKVIGLTGGIGSGKSTVSQCLAELGAVILDADKVGHEAFKPDTEAWRDVVATFGEQVVAPGGEIDRKKLGEIVFSQPEALSRLNQIMHPRMYDMMKTQIEEYRRQGADVVVLEAAVLIEANWTSLADEVWVTVAGEATVLERLKQQRGLAEEQILARIHSQLSAEERGKHAAVVINNDGGLGEMQAKVKELWDRLHA
jgi:dephospho-CoA kinase